jgi:tRNA A-37 threonylcarbamoyl transferase component Bud32
MELEHLLIESIYNKKSTNIFNKYKFIKYLCEGLGSSMVCLSKDMYNNYVVIKKSIDSKAYKKEKETLILLDRFIYTPKLLDYCDKELYIITEWCGNDLRNITDNKRKEYTPHIQNIVKILYDNYKIYHNDVRWKNLTFINNKIFLIDLEMADTENDDLNHDGILI